MLPVSVLFVFLPVILVIFLVAGLIAAKKENLSPQERGTNMIKTVYVYLVLFATLMMTIGGTVAAFMAIADIVSPNAYYTTFEQWKQQSPKEFGVTVDPNKSEADKKKEYDAFVEQEKERSRSNSVNSLIKSFGWIVIPLPVFIFYQRRVKDHPAQ